MNPRSTSRIKTDALRASRDQAREEYSDATNIEIELLEQPGADLSRALIHLLKGQDRNGKRLAIVEDSQVHVATVVERLEGEVKTLMLEKLERGFWNPQKKVEQLCSHVFKHDWIIAIILVLVGLSITWCGSLSHEIKQKAYQNGQSSRNNP